MITRLAAIRTLSDMGLTADSAEQAIAMMQAASAVEKAEQALDKAKGILNHVRANGPRYAELSHRVSKGA